MKFEEDDKNDFWDGEYNPDEVKKPQEPKRPVLKPDDPRYWEEPESEFEHLRGGDNRIWWWVAAAGLAVGLLIAGWVYFFTPYAVNAVQYGYVEGIESRGVIFQSYEGVLLPYKNLMDTTRVYEGDFVFSSVDTDAAVMLRRMQYANRPVRVEYRKYRSVLPWRGDTKYLVVRVDSVDPRNILPPDRQLKYK